MQRLRSALDDLEVSLGALTTSDTPDTAPGWASGWVQPSPEPFEAAPPEASEAEPATPSYSSELTSTVPAAQAESTTWGTLSPPAVPPPSAPSAAAAEPEGRAPAEESVWDSWNSSPAVKDGGWPAPSTPAPAPGQRWDSEPEVPDAGVDEPDAGEKDVRDQVRRAVESLRAELGALETPDVEEPAAEPAQASWSPLAQLPAEEDSWMPPPQSASLETPTDAQDQPIWPGEDASTETRPASWAENGAGEAPRAEDVRDQVRRAVEEARVEMEAGNLASTEVAGGRSDSEGDAREQVRRAVEEARAEMEATRPSALAEGSGWAAPERAEMRIPHHSSPIDERLLMPANIVIDDPEGRVELVRVYRTLARLERASTATLANYSTHSVTVQLEEGQLPSEQEIGDAVNYAFERDCTVEIDGNRASVRLSSGKTRAA